MSRKIACITLDVETDYVSPQKRLRLFENDELMDRYTDLINRNNVKVSAFLVTSLIEKFKASIHRLSDSIPVEFAIHSHAHDMQEPCNREDIEQAVSAFQSFTGHMPVGYRAPVGMITREGLDTLMDLGFQYDSSVYPSIRPGRLGYWNTHMPTEPFKVIRGSDSIIEIPFATLSTVRLVFSLSYVKLLGWGAYSALLKWFPPPKIASVLSHPHDFYFHLVSEDVSGLDKYLLLKDAHRAYEMFEKMIQWLKSDGYEFLFMSEASAHLAKNTDLPQKSIEEWKN